MQTMTSKEYRCADGISRSELFKISRSPLHFHYAITNPAEPTPSLSFGQAAHKYILEPEGFNNEFAVAPDVDRRTKAGKEAYSDFLMLNAEKTIITREDMGKIIPMAEMINANPTAKALLTGRVEQSFFWVDQMTGEKCKCRTDCLSEYEGRRYIVDYKTTDSCEDGHFERSCRKYGYKFQAGMYREGVFQDTFEDYDFAFVAQEKTAPYAVRVYFCDREYVNQGFDQFREYLGIYHECKRTGNWYGYEGPMNVHTVLSEDDD